MNKYMIRKFSTIFIGLIITLTAGAETMCPELLQHTMQKLHSSEMIDLCEQYKGKPLLVVNTASHCGFTPQFEGLEKLHQQFKDRGLKVLGFPSDAFNQEAKDQSETADVCYKNYGVSFDMFAPISIKGKDAHPLFAAISEQSKKPRWNFYKYLINKDGEVVDYFISTTKPQSKKVIKAIENIL